MLIFLHFLLRMTAHKSQRFTEAFQSPTVGMLHINGVTFVFINSMAMEGDGCSLCAEASQSLNLISQQLKCAKEVQKRQNQILILLLVYLSFGC